MTGPDQTAGDGTEQPAGAPGDQATDTAPDSTQEDAMPPRARTTEKNDRASVVDPPSPGFASELDVEQVAPMHYLKHRRTGEITSVGDHGAYLELAQSGWELTGEVPDGAQAPTGGPAI